jgi:hypothetical protein
VGSGFGLSSALGGDRSDGQGQSLAQRQQLQRDSERERSCEEGAGRGES